MRVPASIRRFSRKSTQRHTLPFPACPSLRAAQVTAATFFDGVQPFPNERWGELETYRPSVLVGPAEDLKKLVERVRLGTVDVKSVDRVVFVLTQCGDRPVSDASRVVLWQTFGVPVYELLVGPRGMLLACECQAQEGWHVQPYANFSVSHGEVLVDALGQKTLRTGLLGYIETAVCSCGRAGMRVMHSEAQGSNEVWHELAATA
ncbi:MAG: hypothetical protein ACR2JB_29350 [Bryobacteraceae bacterium]